MIAGIDVYDLAFRVKREQRKFSDKIVQYPRGRWAALAFVLSLFILRVILTRGYAFLAYCLGIFYVSRTVMFLTPAPDEDGNLSSLPDRCEESENKGVQRILPEMQYWSRMMVVTVVITALSCFQCMDVEVIWQVLVFYFIIASLMLGKR